MPPLIICDEHKKKILSLEDFFLDDDYEVLGEETFVVEPIYEFKTCVASSAKESVGLIAVWYIDKNKDEDILVGNIKFNIEEERYSHLVQGAVAQIRSAIIKSEFRGFGIGTNAYRFLCQFFCVASDNIQTCDGAALWKYSIPKLDSIDIRLIEKSLTEPSYILESEGGLPLGFDDTKFEYEKIIWSAENREAFNGAQEDAKIDCAMGLHNKDIILIALRKDQVFH